MFFRNYFNINCAKGFEDRHAGGGGVRRGRGCGRLELFEHEKGTHQDAAEGYQVIPAELLFQYQDGKKAKDGKGNDLLYHFKLEGAEPLDFVADPVGRHLEAVFQQGDRPTDEDDFWKGIAGEPFQVAIPGNGHEDVGKNKKDDCPHRC